VTTLYENLVPPPNLTHHFFMVFWGPSFHHGPKLHHHRLFSETWNICISTIASHAPQIPPIGQLPDLLVLKIKEQMHS